MSSSYSLVMLRPLPSSSSLQLPHLNPLSLSRLPLFSRSSSLIIYLQLTHPIRSFVGQDIPQANAFQSITQIQSSSSQFADTVRSNPQPETSDSLQPLKSGGQFKSIDDLNGTLASLSTANELDLALKLFDELPAHGLSPDGLTYSVIIRCHCKKDDPFEGKLVLDSMIRDGFHPNVITFTTLIDAFSRRGRAQKALEVFNLMPAVGCKPNVQTYNFLLKGLCYVGRVEEANTMLGKMKMNEETVPDIYSYTAVMDGFSKVGRSDEAVELLDEAIKRGLSPGVVTYNSLFNGYCKEGRPRKGIRLLRLMKERGCQPDYITYSSLLHGLLKWGKIKDAYRVHKEMVGFGFKVDERMMNTLLRALCRRSWAEEEVEIKDCYEVWDRMREWEYEIYPNTRDLVIQTLCVGRRVDSALVEMKELIRSGHFPRMVTVNRVIRELCDEGRIEDALLVLVLVCEVNRVPSKISYNILIGELSRRGDVRGACNVYGAALKRGVIPHEKPGGVL